MSQDIYVSVMRDAQTIAQHVLVTVQRTSPMEASLYSAPPYNIYNAYFRNGLPNTQQLRQHDFLQDENNIDYVSQVNTVYSVVNEPEAFTGGFVRCKIEKTRLPN